MQQFLEKDPEDKKEQWCLAVWDTIAAEYTCAMSLLNGDFFQKSLNISVHICEKIILLLVLSDIVELESEKVTSSSVFK